MSSLTMPGIIHTVLAAAGIVLGLVQFLTRKRGSLHRAVGYAFVYAMLIADCAALLVFQFTGAWNILHFGALTSLACMAAGMWPVLRSPRCPDWREKHYLWISWSYVGLLAAAATELVVRTLPLRHAGQAWLVTFAVTLTVTLVGRSLILRHQPAARDPV
ncbi:DUF2306 domain-containing protein [Methylobacterium nonmethylotrophicum]|uniref:DUF2306 domain-containing protein n=1 Tax=Methylobacterium nonmethylotrophicum TaxID=1141884 RepID=A0A4Z0NQD7_9HYPH|nr:DUF2306 domain-containing protein [Methylobacterium nonmethylotrophicum]TGD98941.1 DUF2306 domain-containing protein [Methylobacterium nonmethylotrophicum]